MALIPSQANPPEARSRAVQCRVQGYGQYLFLPIRDIEVGRIDLQGHPIRSDPAHTVGLVASYVADRPFDSP